MTEIRAADPPERRTVALRRAGCLLGFSLGGFFDGILLHQILQWHHLLSAVDAPGLRDLRGQVLADGVFHAAMYAVGLIGLVGLWRAGRAPGSGARLIGAALIGFGAWHVADAVFSHWITGIHRIRMDSATPLAWDLGWLAAFGLTPILLGWRLQNRGGPDGRVRAAAAALGTATIVSGGFALSPPPGSNAVLVLFAPQTPPSQMMAAVASVGGRMVWTDRSGELWAIELQQPSRARALYGRGAWLVGSSLTAGCLSWSKPV